MIQGSPEWFEARLGRVTASRIADVTCKTKTGYGAGRANYMAQLIAERLTGVAAEAFTNAAMAWGTEREPEARALYEFHTEYEVEEAPFIAHPRIDMSGASPDGFVGEQGLVEIKCPNTATHIETLIGQKIPEKYEQQMLWQMACTDRLWCDFVSFDPRMPADLRLFIKRLNRDDDRLAFLEAEVEVFLRELDAKVRSLRDLTKREAA